jgi:hypothetical protein
LTHWNPKKERKAAKGLQLHALTMAAKLLFELSVLQQLGFQKKEVEALVASNRRLNREFQASFESLPFITTAE